MASVRCRRVVVGVPTDTNGDGYLDSALNEVWHNETFGSRPHFSTGCGIVLAGRGKFVPRAVRPRANPPEIDVARPGFPAAVLHSL